MATGYDLKEGKYDQCRLSEKDIKKVFSDFFDKVSKKDSTYKYAMFKSILDNLDQATDKTYKITFDQLYARFSEIYWILVFKYHIPQKAYSVNSQKTLAEKIVENAAEKYEVRKGTSFRELPDSVKREITLSMKNKCSRYVIGALYTDTGRIFYSFSKSKGWIKVNPLVADYLKKHKMLLGRQNYQAWARFYAKGIKNSQGDASYYSRLLKNKLGNEPGITISASIASDAIVKKNKATYGIGNLYDLELARKAKTTLEKYPDVGLYLKQIADLIDCDKARLEEILESVFWCRRKGKRYYYLPISTEDIIMDTLLQKKSGSDSIESPSGDSKENDEERIKMLDDPEKLIKLLKKESQEKQSNIMNTNYPTGKRTINSGENDSTKIGQRNKNWDREEVVILVTEYFRTKSFPSQKLALVYQDISKLLRHREEIITGKPVNETFRNLAGIRLQTNRIRCIDPDTKYSGMQGTVLQREIVQEYLSDPKIIKAEADAVKKKYGLKE